MGRPVGSALDLRQIATPATPAAGTTSVYVKADGNLYKKDSAGVETLIGPSTGGGAAAGTPAPLFPVRAATQANVTLSGEQAFDGVSVVAGDAVLVKAQSTASQNGVYTVATGAWTRHPYFDTSAKVAATLVRVQEGSVSGGEVWKSGFKGTSTLDTTGMTWWREIDSQYASNNGLPVQAADYATTANVTLSGVGAVIDGITVGGGDIILVKNQTVPAENGVYQTRVGAAWVRVELMDTAAEVAAMLVRVRSGTQGGTQWVTNFKSTDTLGTTAMTWTQLGASGAGLGYDTDTSTDYTTTQPPSPATGLTSFARFRARRLPAFVGPTGQDSQLQPALFSNRVTVMMANPGQATPTYIGMTPTNVLAPTAVTPTAPNAAAGLGGSVHRHRFSTSAATAGAGGGFRLITQPLYMTSVANAGGFFIVVRFGLLVNVGRLSFGLSSVTTEIAPASDVRGVVTNFLGFAKNQADTTFFAYSVAGTAATNTATNTTVTAAGTTTLFEARLFNPSGNGTTVYWSMHEITAGTFQQGTLTTNLPALNTALYPHFEFSNGTTAATGSIDIQSVYIETDN